MATLLDDGLLDFLIDNFGLSDESARTIRSVMQSENLPCAEAAARSGLLSSEQLEAAAKWSERRSQGSGGGLIESAMRKSKGQLVPRPRLDQPEFKPGPQLLFAHDPYNPRSEKIRALRTELLMVANAQAMTLAVVGSGAEEGRSLLAAELALSFAQMKRRTLLVDADMRNPTQHLLFQIGSSSGLAEIVDGSEAGLLYRIEGFPSMTLLTAGNTPPNPLELLSDSRFKRLINSWRQQYEYIIIDTPPISLYADALTVATLAQRVLVVSRSKATSFKDLRETLRRIALTQSQVLGAVINDF
jgi:receptor protein-tyrosine kinase